MGHPFYIDLFLMLLYMDYKVKIPIQCV